MRLLCLGFSVVLLVPGFVAGQAIDRTEPKAYVVGAGDVLGVEAYTHDEISGEFAVETTGDISFPLLGRVAVAGLTTSEISNRLEELLEKDYYVDVQLQVEVVEYRSRPVIVLGEVARPGTYYLESETSLHQILAEAGGIKSSAGDAVELRRIKSDDEAAGSEELVFSTARVLAGQEGRDVVLRPGDVVTVSARQRYFVTGEVAKPGQYTLEPGLTLMQAISQAGGLGKFASQTVEIHRGGEDEKKVSTFDLGHIRKGKETDPTIDAGDVLIVRRRFF